MILDTQQIAQSGVYEQDLDTLGFSFSNIIKNVVGVVKKVAEPVLGIVQTVAGGTVVGTAAGVISNLIGGSSSSAPAAPPPPAPVQQPASNNSGLVMVGVGVAALYLLSRSRRR